MPQSFVCMNCHVVFSTKHREPWLADELPPRLYAYIGGIVRAHGSVLVAAGGMPDHVHLIASLSKESSIAELLREIKANSSRWIHETFPHLSGFHWQTGYGAFAVSYSDLERVKQYLREQPQHHRQRTFQEEFIALLKRHNMAYDEQYLWD
jgi:putative transposase